MDTQNNVRVIHTAYSHFKAGDINSLLQLMSNNIQWELPEVENVPFSGKRQGIEKVRDFFSKLLEVEESIEFNPMDFIAEGDRVVVLGNYKWRVKESDLQYQSDFAHVFTVQNGKVIAFREYMNTAAVAAAFSRELAHH